MEGEVGVRREGTKPCETLFTCVNIKAGLENRIDTMLQHTHGHIAALRVGAGRPALRSPLLPDDCDDVGGTCDSVPTLVLVRHSSFLVVDWLTFLLHHHTWDSDSVIDCNNF